MNENYLLLNRAFCIPIESETAKCHPDLGDGRKSYKDNDYYVFQHGLQWYFVPEADARGNNRTMTNDRLDWYKDTFGRENVKTIDELPKLETEV